MKRTVYFNEYNIQMGGLSYLPLVSGLLRAYAETDKTIRDGYRFMPVLYALDRPAAILKRYTLPPDIACFSSLMWNEQLNYVMARTIKALYPDCLIVFGGPNVPMPPQHDITDWMTAHREVDVAVRAEGEEPFLEILRAHQQGAGFADIPGVASRVKGRVVFNETERAFERDMPAPSPYLTGLYDDLLAEGRAQGHEFQAILETNRGCPFPCTFCYWGRGGLSRRYRYKDLEQVKAELDWMGQHQIRYVFNADSNFGMHPRDREIAEAIIATKQRYGFPEKFRTCFGKNTDDRIFAIGALLHAHQLEKGITLARQSNDTTTLANIKRSNIKLSTYEALQTRFNDRHIPVYSELILGLPGETLASWMRGLDEHLEAGITNQLFIYLCQILPNTEMAETAYRERFGIQTRTIQLAEIHGAERPVDFVTEYEEIVIGTASMPHEDWTRALRCSYVLMLLHSLKLGYYLLILLRDQYGVPMSRVLDFIASRHFTVRAPRMLAVLDGFDAIITRMVQHGQHRGTILPAYGDRYWDVEEAAFLHVTQDLDIFYRELAHVLIDCLITNGIEVTDEMPLLVQAVQYQQARIPSQMPVTEQTLQFEWNLPEYFETRFSSTPMPLRRARSWMTIQPVDYAGNRQQFATASILWGRKSGTLLTPCVYGSVAETAYAS